MDLGFFNRNQEISEALLDSMVDVDNKLGKQGGFRNVPSAGYQSMQGSSKSLGNQGKIK